MLVAVESEARHLPYVLTLTNEFGNLANKTIEVISTVVRLTLQCAEHSVPDVLKPLCRLLMIQYFTSAA